MSPLRGFLRFALGFRGLADAHGEPPPLRGFPTPVRMPIVQPTTPAAKKSKKIRSSRLIRRSIPTCSPLLAKSRENLDYSCASEARQRPKRISIED